MRTKRPDPEAATRIAEHFWTAQRELTVRIFEENPWLAFERKPKSIQHSEEYAVHYAIDLGRDDLIDGILDQRVDLECQTIGNRTVLGALLYRRGEDGVNLERWEAQVNKVLDAGARCDALDISFKPLWLLNNSEMPPAIFQRILDGGAPLDGRNSDGRPWLSDLLSNAVFSMAPLYGMDNLKLALAAGANVNLSNPQRVSMSPMGSLAWLNDTAMHEVLLAHGADIHIQDQAGDGLLHVKSSPQVIKWLLANGADLEAKNFDGETPLGKAVMNWAVTDESSIVALLAAGADVDVECCPGMTPRDVLTKRGEEYPRAFAALAARDVRSAALDVIKEIEGSEPATGMTPA